MFAKFRIVVSTGLALFAMFFGAGNMIFPLKVGSMASIHLLPALIAFIISGVGVPFLGVFAVSLYAGDYWKFFNRIGKVPAFIIVTFLMLFIGPLFAGPRTEVITYGTLLPLLPDMLQNPYVFDGLFFAVIFVLVYKQSYVIDIIGWLFSPVKIIAFSLLIILGLYSADSLVVVPATTKQVFGSALTMGYGTMDLLAAFFFCAVAYSNVVMKCESLKSTVTTNSIAKMMFAACALGALLVSFIYAGLIFVGATHAADLQAVPTAQLIEKISFIVLGKYGAVFVAICVSVACLATAATLVEVTSDYLCRIVFRQRFSRMICMIAVIASMYMMAVLGFDGIMKIAGPILNVLYPVLIALCFLNIYMKVMPKKYHFMIWNTERALKEI